MGWDGWKIEGDEDESLKVHRLNDGGKRCILIAQVFYINMGSSVKCLLYQRSRERLLSMVILSFSRDSIKTLALPHYTANLTFVDSSPLSDSTDRKKNEI